MQLLSTDVWDQQLWDAVKDIYVEAFPHGRKDKQIVRRLLNEGEGALHAFANENGRVVGMALTSTLVPYPALLIDYLGVSEALRGQGLGEQFVYALQGWAQEKGYEGIVIEVESTPERAEDDHPNERRVRFWQKCGFTLISYLHDYKVVPELYRAMTLAFVSESRIPSRGEELFHAMGQYHKKAWSRRH